MRRSETNWIESRRTVSMARISGAPVNQGGLFHRWLVRIVYFLTQRKLGRVVMPVQIAAHHGKILWGYGQMEQSLMGSNLVDDKLKGLAQLRVATLIGCPFWIDIGSAVGRKTGILAGQIVNLQDYRSNFNFSEIEKLVLEYADRMTLTPVEVADELPACARSLARPNWWSWPPPLPGRTIARDSIMPSESKRRTSARGLPAPFRCAVQKLDERLVLIYVSGSLSVSAS
jgi:hypothetical protein